MKHLNKQILDNNRIHWVTLRDAGYIKNLNESIVLELETVYREEIDSSFFVNKWCMSCVSEMIMRLYTGVNYDNYTDPVLEFVEAIQSDSITDTTIPSMVNNFDANSVNKTVPKKRGRKSRK
jgi:hypothetical protein